MKARIIQFYQDKIQPRIEALKTRAAQLKQRIAAWATRHKRRLQLAVVVAVVLLAGLALALLWQRSPAFRAGVKHLAAAAAGALAGLWILLKGQPEEVPVPVAVTEPPYPVEAGDPAAW